MKTETIFELVGIARRQMEESEQVGDFVPRSAWQDLWAAKRYAAQAKQARRIAPTWESAYLEAAMERLQRLEGLYRV